MRLDQTICLGAVTRLVVEPNTILIPAHQGQLAEKVAAYWSRIGNDKQLAD